MKTWLRGLFLGFLTVTAAAEDNPAELLFVRRIAPLFQEKCLACHGQDEKIKGGLDLRTQQAMQRGGDGGPAVAPRRPEESPLYLAALRNSPDWKAMPPKDAEKLYAEQVGWIKQWIEGGAPWPEAARIQEIAQANAAKWAAEDGVTVKTSGGLSPAWTNRKYKQEGLWAYQSVQKPAVPVVEGGTPNINPIDAFVAARMPAGLIPGPLADRVTLLRRATFDLTGLPPTPEEVVGFTADPRPDTEAFAPVVERLLASPHYGERMAQHWLDVVRYADTAGFANDYDRGNAWRYRDYVVRAFNSDKPYDQFVREQLAGDEIDPQNPEMLVATGFLRMGPWELTSMEVPKVARQRYLDDVSNSVGETFLALSLQCARCHDHKFDPIPTRDYYSLQAVFASTQLAERPAPFLPAENLGGFEEKKYLTLRRDEYVATLRRLDTLSLEKALDWFREKGIDPAAWQVAVTRARAQVDLGKRKEEDGIFNIARQVMARQGATEDQYPPKLYGFAPEDYGNERVARKGLERLQWELERYEPFALAVYSGRTPDVKFVNAPVRIPADHLATGELEETCILTGGDPFSAGMKVRPGALSVLNDGAMPPIPDGIEGRRRAFAEWVANPANPLTTRAIVNRVWQWHFGQAIAGHPNNFGSTGQRPTHPEMLDWLAATLVERGWSFKALHRVIMMSEAYRRSATYPDLKMLAEKDPAGTSYAAFRPRRLSAEELRDSMLAVTGELNPALGGIPNRTEINLEAALQPRQVMGTFAAAWTPNPLPAQRNRRSIYALKVRGLPDPLMEVFNQPAPDFSCERREASTVTPQVFSLFNGRQTQTRALALANRAVRETSNDEEAIARCFTLAFSRPPTGDELRLCLRHWQKIESMIAGQKPVATRPPLEVRRDAVEENTGEKFSFQEKLPANADYVPDLQPADMPVHTRALADLCLTLFNTNEFAYVY